MLFYRLRSSFSVLLLIAGLTIGVATVAARSSARLGAPADAAAPKLERIDHAAINVKNLETSAAFYKKVFDFDLVHKWNTTWMVGKGPNPPGAVPEARRSAD